jgi:hypothetical protein
LARQTTRQIAYTHPLHLTLVNDKKAGDNERMAVEITVVLTLLDVE